MASEDTGWKTIGPKRGAATVRDQDIYLGEDVISCQIVFPILDRYQNKIPKIRTLTNQILCISYVF